MVFEQFTENARRVVYTAQEEARSLGHDHIGPEHLLLGLVRAATESWGVVELTLASFDISPSDLKKELLRIITSKTKEVQGHIPFDHRAKTVLENAQVEVLRLGHDWVTTGHLLLGLVRDPGVAGEVLARAGVALGLAREAVSCTMAFTKTSTDDTKDSTNYTGVGTKTGPIRESLALFDCFTDRARKAIVLAQEEARALDHLNIGSEHLLLGLIHEGEGVAGYALSTLGVSLDKARQRLVEMVGRGDQPAPAHGHIPFTPRVQQALVRTQIEAVRLHNDYIGTEHILLGLTAVDKGVAIHLLAAMGITRQEVRRRLKETLAGYRPPAAKQLTRLPDRAHSSAILIGTANYTDPDLCELPAVANNIADLATLLTDPQIGGLDRDRVHTHIDPSIQIGERIAEVAENTRDVIVLYYSGHGLVDTDGELYLSLPQSRCRPGRARYTALPFAWIRQALLDSPANAKVVILDCCFSGRAIEAMADPGSLIAGHTNVSGTYTLTSTPANHAALAPEGARHTAFTGELLSLLNTGIPNAGDPLAIGDVYLPLLRAMTARNLPRPQQRGTNTVTLLGLIRNRAKPQI